MTNEELAAAIKNGEHDRINELWEQIQGFGKWLSKNYSGTLVQNGVVFCRQEAYEDLYYSCCYPAMCKALHYFDPDRLTAGGFASLFRYCFMAEAAEFYGYRGKKNPLIRAVSLNAPIPGDDDSELMDVIPDPSDHFEDVDKKMYLNKLHETMEAALSGLNDTQNAVIRQQYYHGKTLENIAEMIGKEMWFVRNAKTSALRNLKRGRRGKELRDLLYPDYDYRAAGLSGNGLRKFQHEGSSTERGAIKALEIKDKAARRREKILDNFDY